MSGYMMVRVLHVFVAVLGAGLVLATGIVSRAGGQSPPPGLLSLVSWSRWSLALLLLTGVAMDVLMQGALHERWWFRLAGLCVIATGVAVARVRSLVLRWSAGDAGAGPQATRTAWLACTLVAVIALLMELKPF